MPYGSVAVYWPPTSQYSGHALVPVGFSTGTTARGVAVAEQPDNPTPGPTLAVVLAALHG